jgi:hypothetical protein
MLSIKLICAEGNQWSLVREYRLHASFLLPHLIATVAAHYRDLVGGENRRCTFADLNLQSPWRVTLKLVGVMLRER